MGSFIEFTRKTFAIIGLSSTLIVIPSMAQIDAMMVGMSAAWSDNRYTHLRNLYNIQNNWTDIRKVYFTRNNAGRPSAMNVSASFIKSSGEDSSVSTFYYTGSNFDSMTISVWDTTTKALKAPSSVAFTYTGNLPASAKYTGIIAMGMSGTFSIWFTYDNQNRPIKDSSFMSLGAIFSQTTISTTEYTSKYEVSTGYVIENGVTTLDDKDSTIYNASGDDSIMYKFEADETSGALTLKEFTKTIYNANGTVAFTERCNGQTGAAELRTFYGYGAMPDPSVKALKVLQKIISKQSHVQSFVNMNSSSQMLTSGITYDFAGRAITQGVQPKAHGVFITKQNNTFTSK